MGAFPCRLWVVVFWLGLAAMSIAQNPGTPAAGAQSSDEGAQLREEVRAHEARIRELEEKLAALSAKQEAAGPISAEANSPPPEPAAPNEHEHSMQLPGG